MICPNCHRFFEPKSKQQKYCQAKTCKADRQRRYTRKYMRRVRSSYPINQYRADRFVDHDHPLPPESVLLHEWSHWDILIEACRLDRRIQDIQNEKLMKGMTP